jgi:hypothetical protein
MPMRGAYRRVVKSKSNLPVRNDDGADIAVADREINPDTSPSANSQSAKSHNIPNANHVAAQALYQGLLDVQEGAKNTVDVILSEQNPEIGSLESAARAVSDNFVRILDEIHDFVQSGNDLRFAVEESDKGVDYTACPGGNVAGASEGMMSGRTSSGDYAVGVTVNEWSEPSYKAVRETGEKIIGRIGEKADKIVGSVERTGKQVSEKLENLEKAIKSTKNTSAEDNTPEVNPEVNPDNPDNPEDNPVYNPLAWENTCGASSSSVFPTVHHSFGRVVSDFREL